MRYLITGAAGFLGSALANFLVVEGNTVRGVDNLSTGNPEVLLPEVHFTRGDVKDRPKLWTLLQDVDCVYHLAARVLVPESLLYPGEYNEVNVGGTVTLMEAMRDVGRCMATSTTSQFGKASPPTRALPTPFRSWRQNIMCVRSAASGVLRRYACGCLMPTDRVSRSRRCTRR